MSKTMTRKELIVELSNQNLNLRDFMIMNDVSEYYDVRMVEAWVAGHESDYYYSEDI